MGWGTGRYIHWADLGTVSNPPDLAPDEDQIWPRSGSQEPSRLVGMTGPYDALARAVWTETGSFAAVEEALRGRGASVEEVRAVIQRLSETPIAMQGMAEPDQERSALDASFQALLDGIEELEGTPNGGHVVQWAERIREVEPGLEIPVDHYQELVVLIYGDPEPRSNPVDLRGAVDRAVDVVLVNVISDLTRRAINAIK